MYKVVTFRIWDSVWHETYEFIGYFTTTAAILEFMNEVRADGDNIYPVSFSYCIGYPFHD